MDSFIDINRDFQITFFKFISKELNSVKLTKK